MGVLSALLYILVTWFLDCTQAGTMQIICASTWRKWWWTLGDTPPLLFRGEAVELVTTIKYVALSTYVHLPHLDHKCSQYHYQLYFVRRLKGWSSYCCALESCNCLVQACTRQAALRLTKRLPSLDDKTREWNIVVDPSHPSSPRTLFSSPNVWIEVII